MYYDEFVVLVMHKHVYIFITLIYLFQYYLLNFTDWSSYGLSFQQKMKDYLTKNFTILRRRDCWYCGLFSFYAVHLGAVNKSLSEGIIYF